MYLHFCDHLGVLCYGFNFRFDIRHFFSQLLNHSVVHFIISNVPLTECLMVWIVLMEEE